MGVVAQSPALEPGAQSEHTQVLGLVLASEWVWQLVWVWPPERVWAPVRVLEQAPHCSPDRPSAPPPAPLKPVAWRHLLMALPSYWEKESSSYRNSGYRRRGRCIA